MKGVSGNILKGLYIGFSIYYLIVMVDNIFCIYFIQWLILIFYLRVIAGLLFRGIYSGDVWFFQFKK